MRRLSNYFAFESRPGENAWLDLIRSVAIVLVLLRHGERAIAGASEGSGFLRSLCLNGWIGVDLFFVLSGYLISRHLIRHGLGSGRFCFRSYVLGRTLRILPAYLAVLALVTAGAFPYYAIGTDHLGLRIAWHLVFLQDYLPSNINVVLWSLGVEEKFYLLAPVLLWLVLSRRTFGEGALVVLSFCALSPALRAVAASMADGTPQDYVSFFRVFRSPFHASLEPLMLGVLIALAEMKGLVGGPVRQRSRTMLFAGIVMFLWLGSHEFLGRIDMFDVIVQPAGVAVVCALLTLGAVQMQGIPLLGERLFRVVARLSYSLYLVHFPLLPLAMALAGGSDAMPVAFWLAYLALSLGVATGVHYLAEKPFLLLKDQLRAGTRPPQTARVAPTAA
jgi:peptidoglycan/LPS O-acetylase OafA/YrhL